MVICPFCGAEETARIDLEGHRFLVFACMFTPQVDPAWDEPTITAHLTREFGQDGSAYFRRACDRLHLYVTRGPAAKELGAPAEPGAPDSG